MNYKTLRYEHAGAVATITLDRPEVLHALNAAMFDELEAAFAELAVDAGVRVVLLTGAGDRAFAAGADIRGLAETDAVSGKRLNDLRPAGAVGPSPMDKHHTGIRGHLRSPSGTQKFVTTNTVPVRLLMEV